MKHTLLLVLVLIGISLYATTATNPKLNDFSGFREDKLSSGNTRFVARISNPSHSDFIKFEREAYDICAYSPGIYLDLLLDSAMYDKLQSVYPEIRITQTEERLKANLKSSTRDLPGYRNYQTMLDELMVLQAMYPNLVRVESIGESWGAQYAAQNIPAYLGFNHQIWAVKLSNNVYDDEDEPAFYFVGEHHAREPISLETVMGILNHLLEGYGIDSEITEMINSSEIWFVPLLNPDGHKLVIDESDVWWRKNIYDNNGNSSIDTDDWGYGADGIDLNRNYGYKWGFINASSDPYSVTYHGASPFSEIETQAFRDLLLSRKFIAGISYHTYGEYVLYPLGYMANIVSPDAAELQALAVAMASTIPKQGAGTYSPMPSYSLYPVSGSSDDWVYGERGIFGFTIEMATEFIPPADAVPGIVANNINAAKLLLKRKNSKMLKGHVTDAITGQALEAMVFVEGIDNNPLKTNQSVSEPVYGAYYRFLPSGTHRVNYTCPGYSSFSMLVNISADAVTVADVALLPAEQVNMVITVLSDDANPIAGASIRFIDDEAEPYYTDQNGQVSLNGFNAGLYRMAIQAQGYEVLHRSLELSSESYTFYLQGTPTVSDDFEVDLSAWVTTGNWGRSSLIAYSGSRSLCDSPTGNYQNNTNSHCRLTQALDLRQVLNANIQFMARYSIALDGDYCMLSYSTNGSTWNYLADFTGISPWQQYSYNLNHLIGNLVYLRFSMVATNSGVADGIYIDDFKLFTSTNPTPVNDEQVPLLQTQLSTYPNPFGDLLNIKLRGLKHGAGNYELGIYNVKGQLVKSINIHSALSKDTDIVWDGKDGSQNRCANGIYFVKLSQKGRTINTSKTILIK